MIKSLSSQRLSYEPLGLSHCSEEYVSWLNNPQIYKYLETGGNYHIFDLEKYLTSVELNNDILFWAIHLKSTGKHIGNIKIDPVNKRHGLGEYGIMMGDTQEWGKGYAKEASIAVINYCFKELNLRKITLGVVERNLSALELYKKLGFEIEGIYKRHGYYEGEYLDIIRMALFNTSYDFRK